MTLRISIAMATYNGAAYLLEQLNSLVDQTRLPDELVVCDDRSTDATVDILETFGERAPFPVRIYRNETRLGYENNFLKAASLCSGDWVAFCDQDDVWLPRKLATVSKYFSGEVLLVLHSAELVDATLEPYGKCWPNIKNNIVRESLTNDPWWTPPGFTQCVKLELIRNYATETRPHAQKDPSKMQAHDQWTYFLANSLGKTAYISESLARYRRHTGTVTGDYRGSQLLSIAKGIRKADWRHYARLSDIAAESADILSASLRTSKNHGQKLNSAISYYRRLSIALRCRAHLHAGTNAIIRAQFFIKLLRLGAYSSLRGKGLGARALTKDLVTIFVNFQHNGRS